MKRVFNYLLNIKNNIDKFDQKLNTRIEENFDTNLIKKLREKIKEKIYNILKIIGLIIGFCISFLLTTSLLYVFDVNWSLLVVFFGLFGLIIYFPFTRRKLKNLIGINYTRVLSFIYMMVCLFYILPVVLPQIESESEKVRFEKMTDKEKEIYQIQKKLELDMRIQRKIEADRARSLDKEEEKYKIDIINENKAQRDYYSRMAAPKLIYKCNGSDREIALAAKIGNINRLLSEAEGQCRSGYIIIDRKD